MSKLKVDGGKKKKTVPVLYLKRGNQIEIKIHTDTEEGNISENITSRKGKKRKKKRSVLERRKSFYQRTPNFN